MSNVTEICKPRVYEGFTLTQVNDLIPLLIEITKKHQNAIENAMDKQRFLMKSGASQERVTECDNIVGEHMRRWGVKMYKLGAKVMPGGYLGFDSGCFYWSWHFGETECEYQHSYEANPSIEICRHRLEAKAKVY